MIYGDSSLVFRIMKSPHYSQIYRISEHYQNQHIDTYIETKLLSWPNRLQKLIESRAIVQYLRIEQNGINFEQD